MGRRDERSERRRVHLSPRQAQIVSLIASGHSTKEIALRLGMSPHTVQCHVDRLFSRYDVHSRAQLVASCAGWMVGLEVGWAGG